MRSFSADVNDDNPKRAGSLLTHLPMPLGGKRRGKVSLSSSHEAAMVNTYKWEGNLQAHNRVTTLKQVASQMKTQMSSKNVATPR